MDHRPHIGSELVLQGEMQVPACGRDDLPKERIAFARAAGLCHRARDTQAPSA